MLNFFLTFTIIIPLGWMITLVDKSHIHLQSLILSKLLEVKLLVTSTLKSWIPTAKPYSGKVISMCTSLNRM